MDIITKQDLTKLAGHSQPPCVSLYLPTHRGCSEQDPTQLKNLLGEAQERLMLSGTRRVEARELLKPARDLLEDGTFWKNQSDGLAVFLAPGVTRTLRLPLPFHSLAVVGPRFHLKPLLPALGDNGLFFVLALSQDKVRLFQGTHYNVHEVDLKGVPKSMKEALIRHDRDEPLEYHTQPALGYGRKGAIFSGQGVGIDDAKDDLLLYFRQIDAGLRDLLPEEHAPLVLASVEYLWPIYRKASTYPNLLAKGVAGNPDHLSAKQLHARAWPLVKPLFQAARGKAAERYLQLAGTGLASGDVGEIERAAHQGRIAVLFAPVDHEHWGTFEPATAALTECEANTPGCEDLLELAAAQTLMHRGTVYGVASEEMPGKAELAAMFRKA